MSLAASTPTALPTVKMEDRKRPAASATEEVAPPPKRQALVNGSKVAEGEEDAWIEKYQKGAIYRQMLEYKRQAQTLEKEVEELQKKTASHDDHIRIMDAWCQKLVEDIELMTEDILPERPLPDDLPFTNILFKDDPDLQKHVDYGKATHDRVEKILKKVASMRNFDDPATNELRSTVSRLLASEKSLKVKLDRLEEENAELSTKLNDASYRVVKAEKKLNRLKSTQVQKMEQAAVANATRSAGGSENGKDEVEINRNSVELQQKLDEALAVEAKNREQLEAFSAEIRKLQEENSTLKARRESLTDEDFIRTDVFKAFKTQNEDLIKKVNHLEAVAVQLRDQNTELSSRQTSFQLEVEMAAQKAIQDLEEEVRQKDQDLARIRSARDEILADREMRKVSMEQETKSMEYMTELVSAKDDRITFLEHKLARQEPGEDFKMEDIKPEFDKLSLEELREQYQKLHKVHTTLSQELPSIEQAFKKSHAVAQKKVMDFKAMEEQLAMARAEKAKADQKYFAVRKDTDTRMEQNKALRLQNSKSSEVIEKLKESESQRRNLIANLEKQMALVKQSSAQIQDEIKKKESESADATRRAESYKAQLTELTTLLRSKDAAASLIRDQTRAQEEEVERIKVRLEHVQKDRDNWKQKAHANSSEEEELLRKSLSCNVCNQNFKNTVLKTCGHLFCSSCVETRLSSRMRKCPSCARPFDKMDVMAVHGLGF